MAFGSVGPPLEQDGFNPGVPNGIPNPLSQVFPNGELIPKSITATLPWATRNTSNNNSGTIASAFFPSLTPNSSLWDKLMPYRLLVVDTSKGMPQNISPPVVGGQDPSNIVISPLGNGTLAFMPLSTAWEFFLPITPQQLNITDNYSINTSATLRGILEEHSGVRFKNITIQGTFGVWPGRPPIVKPPGTPSVLQSLFGGTINAAQNVAAQFQSTVNAALTGTASAKPTTVTPGSTNDSEGGFGTGYYQTIMFQQFLEQYAEAKRDPNNAGWRLVFDIPKQNQSFVVTPVAFNWKEDVNKPMEINYTLQLKAWRRINLLQSTSTSPANTPISPGVLQQILNTVSAAQNTAAAAAALIGSVRSDVDNILNVIRQTGLFVKGLAGVAVALSDLPSQLISDVQSTATNFLVATGLSGLSGSAATNSAVTSSVAALQATNTQNEGLSSGAVSSGQLGPSTASAQMVNPANNVYQSPQLNPMLFSQVPVSSLKLNSQQQTAYQNEVNNVNDFTVQDLKNMRATIQTLCVQLENSFGASNQYYSKIYGTPYVPNVTNAQITLDQYDLLNSFYDMLQSYDILTATSQLDSQDTLVNMEYVQSLAQTAGIEFAIPNSKIQVPVPFGLTPEGIALRYLGDVQRWLEIATLNNLREPYIDENGFQYDLLSNANGRNVVVGFNQDLFVGQPVSIRSNTQSPTTRTVLDITMLSPTSFLITLDGEADLDIYTISDGAYLQAYLPGTTNSQNTIFIPSDIQTPDYDGISIPTSVANTALVGLSKVDWLLVPNGTTTSMDVAATTNGDIPLAAGITNFIQALNIKMGTVQKSSYVNPGFGLPFRVGSSVADFKAQDIYIGINNMIANDPRFSGVSGLQINQSGPQLNINMGVTLAGQAGVFPIGFQLPIA